MLSASFLTSCGCPRTTTWPWNCDQCGFSFYPHVVFFNSPALSSSPGMSAVFLPILTHSFDHISHKIDHSQEQYENSAFSEFCFSGVMTLLVSHYLVSVMSFSLCFNQNLCPFVHTVFGNMPSSPSQWLFHVSATGCNFLQLPPQSPLNQTLLNCPHLL